MEAGCSDADADNYNPDATSDDGSCVYMRNIHFLSNDTSWCGPIDITLNGETKTIETYGFAGQLNYECEIPPPGVTFEVNAGRYTYTYDDGCNSGEESVSVNEGQGCWFETVEND